MQDAATPPSLAGKTVLVTGGAHGIGAATAELFAQQGARVVVADVSVDAGQALAARLGPDHRFVQLDVSRLEAWQAALPAIAPDGRLDVVVLNAGIMTRPLGEMLFNDPLPWITPARMEQLIGVNLYGVLWGIQACLPLLEKSSGTLLVTSSLAGIQPFSVDPAYAMTKYGLIGLASSLAPTLKARGVRIVSVCPCGIDTRIASPDLQAKRTVAGTKSPPSDMAEATLHVYRHAQNGEIWLGGANRAPFRYEPAPVSLPRLT